MVSPKISLHCAPRWLICAASCLGVVTYDSASAAGRDMVQYFTGKSITVIVGSAPGGGADYNARLFAKHAGKYFPGHPSFIVENLPGGGQLRGLQAAMRAKPDGLTAASLQPVWAAASVLGRDLKPYDVKTARVVGAPLAVPRGELVCADRRIYKSWKDILASGQPLKVGGNSPGSRETLGAALMQHLGGPIKMVYGYGGVAEITAAFDRGELNGVACTADTVPRLFPEWLKQKRLTPLFWWGTPPAESYIEQMGSETKPVELFSLEGQNFPPDAKIALKAAQDLYLFTRALVLGPIVPDDIYETWKEAFAATIRDKELVETAAKGGLEIELGQPDEFVRTVNMAAKLSPGGLDVFKKLMGVE